MDPAAPGPQGFRQVVLRRRPDGTPRECDFEIETASAPDLGAGQFLVRNLLVSLDPAIRQRLTGADSYLRSIALGAALTSTTLGQVVASREPRARIGDHVVGLHTVGEYSVATWTALSRRVDPSSTASATNHLSVLGPTGLTAYFGLLDVGRPQPGETVLVSSAAGAVGSVVAQIARIQGCRVVGIAGGDDKCRRLTQEFGLDAAINYRGLDVHGLITAIGDAAPAGVDVYFDNVGGIQLDAALACLNLDARVALCGLISEYNAPPRGLGNLFQVIARCVTVRGFTVLRYAERFPEALTHLANWVAEGRIVFEEHVESGIERTVPAFLSLFDGAHRGKVIVDLR